jgi:hypothetical protein
MKQPDFMCLKGKWKVMYYRDGNTELISDRMTKELEKRRNSPKNDRITLDELFNDFLSKKDKIKIPKIKNEPTAIAVQRSNRKKKK